MKIEKVTQPKKREQPSSQIDDPALPIVVDTNQLDPQTEAVLKHKGPILTPSESLDIKIWSDDPTRTANFFAGGSVINLKGVLDHSAYKLGENKSDKAWSSWSQGEWHDLAPSSRSLCHLSTK